MYRTIRTVYLNILTELVKEESPVLYLEDFLYYYNKAISDYMKLRYEKFEMTQQLTDDMRVWKKIHNSTELEINIDDIGKAPDGTITAPYRHLLGCIIDVELLRPVIHCEQRPHTVKKYKGVRSTSDRNTGLVDNVYFEARFYRPYFDIVGNKIRIDVGDYDKKIIKISNIQIEYLRQPVAVNLTEEQVENESEDTSQILEFPIDVEEEITKLALVNILERQGNQRLSTHMQVNKTVNDASLGAK
jgi:hypothetical protein